MVALFFFFFFFLPFSSVYNVLRSMKELNVSLFTVAAVALVFLLPASIQGCVCAVEEEASKVA